MASNWLVKQWQDVSGNVKFGVLLLLGTGIMSGATALTHGLATWQQVGLVGLFAVMFGWALIATFVARRQKQGGFIVTQENLESYVRQWLDNFHVTAKKLPKNDQVNFAYQVDYEDRTHVAIFHAKERYQYLAFEGKLAVSKEHKDAFDKLSEPKKRRFLLGLRVEMARAGIRAEMPHPFETVRIVRLFPMTALTESEFIEQLDGVHRAELLIIDTINLGLEHDVSPEAKSPAD